MYEIKKGFENFCLYNLANLQDLNLSKSNTNIDNFCLSKMILRNITKSKWINLKHLAIRKFQNN